MKNKTILITGGTTGIGFATAQLLAAEGAKVIVTGRNPKTLEAARAALPAGTVLLQSDAGSLEAALALGSEVQKHTERLDGVFLNAGVAQFSPLETHTPAHYEDMFNINVRGPFFQLQSLLPLLAKPSSVIFTSSVVAQIGFQGASLYSATKAAVTSFGKTLAAELAPRGIRVNVISPGPVKTPIFNSLALPADQQKAFEEGNANKTLLKRLGQPEEIAKLARFLLSEDSSFIVGEEVLIDGGLRWG
jgi:NAD(P)-dependent dehydrogenase (short-subunit alcohol dehydrogenase family)